MEKPYVVNLFAGPGTGKSTTAAGIFSLLKLHGVNCEYVPEFAKDLTWEQRFMTLANQIYVFGKQHHRLWRLKDQVDVIVTDSPLLHSLVYGVFDLEMVQVIMKQVQEFSNLNYFLKRMKPYNPKGRNQTLDEAKALDGKIRAMLIGHQIAFEEINGTCEAINVITNMVLDCLGLKQTYQVIPYTQVGMYE